MLKSYRMVKRFQHALLTGCQQMDWDVLAWNPARKFYDRHGAIDITETDSWHFYRLKKDAMEALD